MNIYNNLNKLSNINLMNVIYSNQTIYYELRNNNYFKGNNYNFLDTFGRLGVVSRVFKIKQGGIRITLL